MTVKGQLSKKKNQFWLKIYLDKNQTEKTPIGPGYWGISPQNQDSRSLNFYLYYLLIGISQIFHY